MEATVFFFGGELVGGSPADGFDGLLGRQCAGAGREAGIGEKFFVRWDFGRVGGATDAAAAVKGTAVGGTFFNRKGVGMGVHADRIAKPVPAVQR